MFSCEVLKRFIGCLILFLGSNLSTVLANPHKQINQQLEVADRYIKLAEKLETSNSDSCFMVATKANQIALENIDVIDVDSNWKEISMKAHYFIACYHGRLRNIEKMFAHYDSAWVFANQLQSLEYIAKVGSNKGAELIIEGKFVLEGQQFLEKANNAAILTGEKFLLVRTQTALAYFFQLIGEHQTSVDYIRPNLKYLQENKLDFSELTCISIANSFIKLGQADSAIYYLENNLKLYQEQELISYTASLRTFLGKSYFIKGRTQEALQELKKSLAIFTNNNNIVWPETYQCLGAIYLQLDKADSSAYYYQKAIDICTQVSNINQKGKSYLGYSKALQMGENYKDAFRYFKLHFEIYRANNALKFKNEIMREQLVFEKEKKAYSDSLKRVAENEKDVLTLENAELNSSKSSDYRKAAFVGAGWLLVALLLVSLSVRSIKKENVLLEESKEEAGKYLVVSQEQQAFLNKQNKEIEDSFRYAELIQNTVLPKHILEANFKDNVEVLYQTPNILSSDFYFYHNSGHSKVFAVFSSQKMGVPGTLNNLMINYKLSSLVDNFSTVDGLVKDLSAYVNAHLRNNNKENKIDFSIVVCSQNVIQFCGCSHDLLIERMDDEILLKGSLLTLGEIDTNIKITDFSVEKGDRIILGTRNSMELYLNTAKVHNSGAELFEKTKNKLAQLSSERKDKELCLLAIEL